MNTPRFILLIAVIIIAGYTVFDYYHKKANTTAVLNSSVPSNKPCRIISLSPDITEILFELRLDERIAAVSSDSDYPPATANKKKVGTFWQPNTEAIIACKPDLVIAESFEQQKVSVDSLNRLGYQVLSLKIEKIEELLTAIRQIGDAAGCTQRAGELVKNIENKLNESRLKFGAADKVKILWVVQPEPLRVAGRNTFINELIELAGGENAIGSTLQQYPPLGTEGLIACGPEVIIQPAMGTSSIAEQQKAAKAYWSRFTALPAVKNNKVYVIESDTVLRPGPRLPEGIELIARYLHGDSKGNK